MTEWKLFHGDVAEVSTPQFHQHRERAAHLEEPEHRPRLARAAEFIFTAANVARAPITVSDLGCGDGGLLSLIGGNPNITAAWGYDFAPANSAGWPERGVRAEHLDVFGVDRDRVQFGTVTAVTEVLEHLTDPHGVVQWIGSHSRFIVASSPWDEHPGRHDECHAWAFDVQGYRDLIGLGGYRILRHEMAGRFQVILGVRV
jgi:SAM-dependent methyltransferase